MEDVPASPDRLIFEAVLRPQRSLPSRALLGVTAALAGVSLWMSLLMLRLGAWPVIACIAAGFCLTALLFALNQRAAKAREIIEVSEEHIRVTRVSPLGRVLATDIPPAWATALLEERPGTVPRLTLGTRANRVEVGAHLGEAAKRSLAVALIRALARQRSPG